MGARPKVPKERERLVSECESHLKFLAEALRAYETDPDRYKQVAGELRILVCSTKTNKPLLLDLLDSCGLNYCVHPIPDLPFPITMVGDIHKPPEEDFSKLTPEEIWARHRVKAKPVPLRDFIDRGLAVFIAPYEFSYRDLILAVAHQIGGAHEDREVEVALLELEQFLIGGYSGYGAPLRHIGSLVFHAGKYLIRYIAESQGYKPHYFTGKE